MNYVIMIVGIICKYLVNYADFILPLRRYIMSDIYSYSPLWDKWEIVSEIGSGLYGTVYKIKAVENGETIFCVAKHIEVNIDENLIEEKEDNTKASENNFDDEDRIELSPAEKVLNERIKEIETNYSFAKSKNLLIYEEHTVYEKENGIGYDIFIRMPYYESLSEILKKENLSDDEKIKLGVDICNALSDLENNDIFHGDIKPENIFRDNKGSFLLADFGIEKRPDDVVNKKAVQQNVNFMAPELQENKSQKKTSDIYSLGLLLYKLFNKNNEPFLNAKSSSEDKNEAILKRIKGVPFPAPKDADDELSKIILIACQFSPEARWMNAASFKNALLGYSSKKTGKGSAVRGSVIKSDDNTMAEDITSENETDIINTSDTDDILTQNDIEAFDLGGISDNADSQQTKVFDAIKENSEDSLPVKYESEYDNFTDPEFDFDEDDDDKSLSKGKFALIIVGIILVLALLGCGIYYAISTNMFGSTTSTPDNAETTISETEATTIKIETQPASTAPTTTKPTEKPTDEPAPDSVTVPYIVGMDYSSAMDELSYAGLYASIDSYEYSDYYDANTIISVYPSEGTSLELGDTVSIVISQGPKPQEEPQRETESQRNNTSASSTTVQKTGGYILEGSDSRFIDKSEISSMDESMLTLAINEIYARHGYIFTTPSLSEYFNSKTWYNPQYTASEFNSDWFNEYEKKNINTINDLMKEKGYR